MKMFQIILITLAVVGTGFIVSSIFNAVSFDSNYRYNETNASINYSSFDASKLNFDLIEKQILEKVNAKREEQSIGNLGTLRWNDKIASICREHSQDMLNHEYLSHKTLINETSLETTDFEDRLKERNVFYFVSNENIALLPVNSSTDIAEEVVNSWLNSPGHRSNILDLDGLYTDSGVGVSCADNVCYITMDFIGLSQNIETNLKPNYVLFQSVYDIGLGFTSKINVSVRVNSTEMFTFFYVNSDKDYEQYIQGNSIKEIIQKRNTYSINVTLTAEPGNGIIIENEGFNTADIIISLDYADN
jgi:uncharacterized protein YkwD